MLVRLREIVSGRKKCRKPGIVVPMYSACHRQADRRGHQHRWRRMEEMDGCGDLVGSLSATRSGMHSVHLPNPLTDLQSTKKGCGKTSVRDRHVENKEDSPKDGARCRRWEGRRARQRGQERSWGMRDKGRWMRRKWRGEGSVSWRKEGDTPLLFIPSRPSIFVRPCLDVWKKNFVDSRYGSTGRDAYIRELRRRRQVG